MTPGVDEPIIRTRRIEVVDGDGRTRAIVGDLSGAAQPEQVFGVALVDTDGRHRAWLALDDNGASLAFDRAGNAVLELGVDDGAEAVRTGAYVQLSDVDGRPALGWRVDDEGGVVLRVTGRAP
ncbi:MAG TPA: hypothetical protein VHF47_08310 [Acidimicrobiales bacterium]|nr:hypothetical protein [Acidimicrobiales bacterium]